MLCQVHLLHLTSNSPLRSQLLSDVRLLWICLPRQLRSPFLGEGLRGPPELVPGRRVAGHALHDQAQEVPRLGGLAQPLGEGVRRDVGGARVVGSELEIIAEVNDLGVWLFFWFYLRHG